MGPFTQVIDASGRRTHQSTATNHLVVPSVNPSSIGSRVFPVVPVSPNPKPADLSDRDILVRRMYKYSY